MQLPTNAWPLKPNTDNQYFTAYEGEKEVSSNSIKRDYTKKIRHKIKDKNLKRVHHGPFY